MAQKALLVGSSFSAAPILTRLKRRGFHVAVCGNAENDPCHQYADQSCFVDYSDKEKLLELVQREKFDFIVPSCNDFSYMACAWVAEQCEYPGFDSYDVADIIHTKTRFRKAALACELRAPKFEWIEGNKQADPNKISFPALVKPTDSFSGRNVTKISSAKDLPQAIEKALKGSRSGKAIIEEFVDGQLHSHSAFIRNGQIIFDVFVDEYCSVYPYQVDCSCHPSALSEDIRTAVRAEMLKLIRHLKLCDGLLHTQFIANGKNFWIIECMRRCPGDVYFGMIELSTGVDYVDLYVQPFIGEKLPTDISTGKIKFISRHTISVASPVIANTFSFKIPAREVRIVPLKISGEQLNAAPYDKLAILFAEHETEAGMRQATPLLASLVDIQQL